MDTYNEIKKGILECSGRNECGLRPEYIKGEEVATNYNAFQFNYSRQDAKKSKYVIVTQNPGPLPKGSNSDGYKELLKATDDDFVQITRRGIFRWFHHRNKHFFQRFFETLRECGLIDFNGDLEHYLKHQFLSDFLVTDLVKCRARTESVAPKHIKKCAERYLCRELECFGRGKLILAISSRTWEFIFQKFAPGMCRKHPGESDKNCRNVSKVHGRLFRSDVLNAHFIPLAHFSQRLFNSYLRDSYFDYLKDGLEEFRAIRAVS